MIPRRRPTPVSKLMTNIVKSILKGEIFEGKYIKEFETAFSEYIGTKYAFSISSGRIGMKLILEALDLKKGSEIIMPSYTLADLAKIVKSLEFKPVFIDIKNDTMNMDENLIEKKLTSSTRVILATHLWGLPCNVEKILKIAKKNNLIVIEDCAHSLGSEFKGKKVGSFGEASFFSFERTKPINCLGGGMIVTNNNKIAKKIEDKIKLLNYSSKKLFFGALINYIESSLTNKNIFWVTSKFLRSKILDLFKKFYRRFYKPSEGTELKFSNLQAKIGLEQLKKIDETNKKRIEIAKEYSKLLYSNRRIQLPRDQYGKHIYYTYIVKTKRAKYLYDSLYKSGIDTGYSKDIMENCGWKITKEHFPNTEKILKTALQIPLYLGLKIKEIDFIANSINHRIN